MLTPGRHRTDDVFRSMEVRVLSPKLRVGKTLRSGALPDNRNVIAAARSLFLQPPSTV